MNKRSLQIALHLMLALVFSLSAAGLSVQNAHATTYAVTNLNNSGAGSLRQAIMDANSHAGADTITFSLSGTIILGSSLPDITDDLTIDGSGRNITISGTHHYRVMYINGKSLTINKLTIINGHSYSGAGIYNDNGILTVMNSTFSGNSATGSGGAIVGIYYESFDPFGDNNMAGVDKTKRTDPGPGDVTVVNSTFSNNSAAYGGAIYHDWATLTVNSSTFNGNSAAGYGGAIYADCSDYWCFEEFYVTNSTFSGNNATGEGGAIYADEISDTGQSSAVVTSINNTFSGNGATDGGGIFIRYDKLNLKNTILANSTSGGDCTSDGNMGSDVNNLIENHSGCGTPVLTADPKLGALANNGGPTRTFALQPTSPAIGAGDNATCAASPVNNLDQRGYVRPLGTVCDIGSYEAPVFRSYSTYDGWVLESGENTNVGGTRDSTATTFRLGDAAGDKQYRAILSFTTQSLPDDAVITGVTLRIMKAGLAGTNPFTILGGLKVDIRKPFFGTTLGLMISDFQAGASASAVGTFGATPVNNWYIATIGSAGYPYINKTGHTQFRLRFELDDNNDNAADYMSFYSGNYSTITLRPTLVIKYYIP